jgi:predicted PurR-regulated permease PerM
MMETGRDADGRRELPGMPGHPERARTEAPAEALPSRIHLDRTTLQWAVFLGAVSGVFYLCFEILSPFLPVVGWSSVLVIAFEPVHRRISRKIRGASLAALVSTLLAGGSILVPLALLITLGFDQFLRLRTSLQLTFTGAANAGALEPLEDAREWLARTLGLDPGMLQEWLAHYTRELGRLDVESFVTLVTKVTGGVVYTFFTLFAMFLLFRDGKRIVARIPDLLPFERARTEEFLARLRGVLDASIRGVLVIAGIQAALIGLGFAVLGVPYAGLWATVTLFTSPFPMVGTWAVWLPGSIYLVLGGHGIKALFLLAWGALIVSSVDNFVRPKLVAERVGIDEFFMFLAILGGLPVFGALGIVMGPVVFAAAAYLLEALSRREPDPVGPHPPPEPGSSSKGPAAAGSRRDVSFSASSSNVAG